ncbi:MAG: efflux RND transporter periplasmic adaptor subunit [Gemmatimonadaceae bacterium]|jgi:RND family efflux transporter MFP subunit
MPTMHSFPSRALRAARFAFLAGIAAASAACGGAKSGDTAAPPVALAATDVMPAATADIGPSVVVSGALDPADVVRVRAQVAGTLRDVKVDRGAKVSRGQMLARIEALGVTTGAEGARANVSSAEAAQAVALQRLEGARKLFEAGAMSVIDLKTAQAGFDAAVAQLAAARAGLASASEAAGHTTMRSPIDGWVSDRVAEEGESVKSDDPVFTVVDPRTLELKGQVGAADAAHVRVGQLVTFTIDGMPGQQFKGTVARVDPMASATTRQVGVFTRLANGGGKIVAGQFAHGRIRTGAVTRMVVVPMNAVRAGERESFVLVVDGDVVRRRAVATGARDEDAGSIVIVSGLKAGERIVVTAGVEIADGTKVSTAKEK